MTQNGSGRCHTGGGGNLSNNSTVFGGAVFETQLTLRQLYTSTSCASVWSALVANVESFMPSDVDQLYNTPLQYWYGITKIFINLF